MANRFQLSTPLRLPLWSTVLLVSVVPLSLSSRGDGSFVFQRCLQACLLTQCNATSAKLPLSYSYSSYRPRNLRYLEKLITWECNSECKYHCMWWAVDAFQQGGQPVPQFYGKLFILQWPQIRLLGIQEPASALFSALNFITQLVTLLHFLRHVPYHAPLFSFWILFALAGLNAWLWSTVFHICDTSITEKLDYCSAFAYVGSFFILTLARILYRQLRWVRFAFLSVAFYLILSYLSHLIAAPEIDYEFNMNVHLAFGLLVLVGWVVGLPNVWTVQEKAYSRQMQATVLFIFAAASLEFFDFPPIWWLFDAHSLWHAATIFVPFAMFS
ncbi:unnamed protein product [Mesocestoides corti]|uniref:Post-GPI attachment to proteins factor 3 n=1 Tax=Mesocestoides corti TaxID=53468 RepID=A0A0R3UE72_MESCO|nr:unnamed protein product [Mesocestoides corti]